MSTWTDEMKATAIEKYLAAEPTAANSMEIVKEIAEEMDESVNGVRMILSQKGVYVKKETATSTSSASKATGDKPARVSKEAAHARLTESIEALNQVADGEIISKLTGKAAVYFAEVFEALK